MKSWLVLVAVMMLGAGCDVGGGKLTGAGGGMLPSGAGGAAVMTGSGGGIVTGGGAAGPGGFGGVRITDDWCGKWSHLTAIPPDIMVVLDTSATMSDGFDGPCAGGCTQSKWSAARYIIESVVAADSPDASWGLQLFTDVSTDACTTAGVTVPIGTTTATGIRSELSRRTAAGDAVLSPGNRPTRAAIRSATAHLLTRFDVAVKAILLITDGVPGCASGVGDPLASDGAGAVQAISDATSAGVATLVAGMAIPPEAESTLSQMALAGGLARTGSPPYHPVSSSADLAAAVSALLAQTARCFFAIPPPPTVDGTPSRGDIGVQIDDSDVPMDAQDGWTYVDASMTALQLHGLACDAARADGAVSIYFRCLLP